MTTLKLVVLILALAICLTLLLYATAHIAGTWAAWAVDAFEAAR